MTDLTNATDTKKTHHIDPKKFMRTFDRYVKTSIQIPSDVDMKDVKVFEIDDVLFFDGLLTSDWCKDVIARTDPLYESICNEYPKKSRDVQRFLSLDDGLAQYLWTAIRDKFAEFFKDAVLPIDSMTHRPSIPFGFGVRGKWEPYRINECFRFNRYTGPSLGFEPHRDSLYVENYDNRSIYTILIYLNDVSENDGGDTVFIKSSAPNRDHIITVQDEMLYDHQITSFIKPKTGLVAVMAHNRIHRADQLKNNHKYVIRSDIIFRCYERPESYSSDLWTDSELFHRAVGLYNDAKKFEMAGDVEKASKAYDEGLAIRQSTYI